MTPERAVNPASEADQIPGGDATTARGKLLYFPSPVQEKVPEKIHGHSRRFLLVEFLLLFVGLPLVLFSGVVPWVTPLDALWVAAGYCLLMLLRDPTFDRGQLWRSGPLRRQLPQMLALFALAVVVITVMVHQYAPQLLLSLVRKYPGSFALVMLTYPFASVYPQALVYRAYTFHRYERLVQPGPKAEWILILVSAATFSFVHILFHNWIAIALTFPGGIIFARRYMESRSLCVSCVEHTLYGWLLFTIGLGQYFGVRVF